MNYLRLFLPICLMSLCLRPLPLEAQEATSEDIFQTHFQGVNVLQGWQNVDKSQAWLVLSH